MAIGFRLSLQRGISVSRGNGLGNRTNTDTETPMCIKEIPFREFLERMEFNSLSVDLLLSLRLFDLFEFEDESLDHRLGAVHLVVLTSLAQGGLDDIAWKRENAFFAIDSTKYSNYTRCFHFIKQI